MESALERKWTRVAPAASGLMFRLSRFKRGPSGRLPGGQLMKPPARSTCVLSPLADSTLRASNSAGGFFSPSWVAKNTRRKCFNRNWPAWLSPMNLTCYSSARSLAYEREREKNSDDINHFEWPVSPGGARGFER